MTKKQSKWVYCFFACSINFQLYTWPGRFSPLNLISGILFGMMGMYHYITDKNGSK